MVKTEIFDICLATKKQLVKKKKRTKGDRKMGETREMMVFFIHLRNTYIHTRAHTHTHTHTLSCVVRISGSYNFQGSFPPQSCTVTPNSNIFPKHW